MVWFFSLFFIYPASLLATIFLMRYSKNKYDQSIYHIEKFHKKFIIRTNANKRINYSILLLELINLLWAIIGTILDSILRKPSYRTGAIIEVLKREYGLGAGYIAICFLFLNYAHILRIILYVCGCMYHREVFGWLEARYRRDL